MKRIIPIIMVALLLVGCSNSSSSVDRFLLLREKSRNSSQCLFDAAVTIDYGDSAYSFSASCKTDTNNNMLISIVEPEAISGIQAEISGDAGKITFDDQILAFEMIANEQIAPICLPWLMMKALYGGYISSSGVSDELTFARIDDTYNQTEFSVEIWLNNAGQLSDAEILWDGRRIASIKIDNFVLM